MQKIKFPSVIFFIPIVFFALFVISGCNQGDTQDEYHIKIAAGENEDSYLPFEADLEAIRQTLKIPGMSAAVVSDQELVWASGFGYADLENQRSASPDTPYGLASVTKPIAATVIMQLVEAGKLDLDAQVSQYGVNAGNDEVTVRHLLTHTSEGELGSSFYYNGGRYALLGGVIEGASGKTFAETLSEGVLLPLGMRSSALNPINDWYGPTTRGGEDIIRMIGFGENFQHYPDVFSRLAQPYQFDEHYNLIPGKYHLHHNPAAGMNSSVADLAKFDIALDQGVLLGDPAKAEMFTPAISTHNSRQDLRYGLGWYIQDFDDLRLLWHTGRWPPSTSGLYLKVPELNLTFIVLANTDNLTVPFNGIGRGDLSQSALALAFFRHFIYPEVRGIILPEIDWSVPREALINQLSELDDPETRFLLERELWSFRQMYASVGRDDQVQKLWDVDVRAFPASNMRSEPLYTNTTGKFEIISPVISAAAFHRISWGIIAWFIMIIGSLVWMVVVLFRAERISKGAWLFWLLATWFLGPLSILTYMLVNSPPLTNWRQTLRASLYTSVAYASGWILAITILIRSGDQSHPLAILGITYLTPFLVSVLFFRAPFWLSNKNPAFIKQVSAGLLTEIILFNVGYAVMFPLTMIINDRLLTTIPSATSLYFWGLLSIIVVACWAAQFPFSYWLTKRGYRLWPFELSESQRPEEVPGFREAWQQLAVSVVVMIAALALTISQIA